MIESSDNLAGHRHATDHVWGLMDWHLAELRRSGLSDETIRTAGIYTEKSYQRLASILNWGKYAAKHGPGLVFPYHDETGAIVLQRVKPSNPRARQGKPVKYEHPKGAVLRLYIPVGARNAVSEKLLTLAIVEGEKKALCLCQNGLATVGLAGVSAWCEPKSARLLPDLERIDWQGRAVYLIWDSDLVRNEAVQLEEAKLAAALMQRGAQVRVVRLPDGPPGKDGKPTKQGADDFVVANGMPALWKLLESAELPEPPMTTDLRQPATKMDPRHEIERLLEIETVDGLTRYAYWNGSLYRWSLNRYTELVAGEVRARLAAFLNKRWSHLTTFVVSNCSMQLQAQTLVLGTVPMPSWLGTPSVEWDPRDVLACRNGLLHLPSLLDGGNYLLAPTPRFFSATAVDYDFAPDPPQPTGWLKFVDDLWGRDTESVELLQMWFGYCLVADLRQEKLLLIIGPPRSGKGTIATVLKALLGKDNVCGPSLSSLAGRFGLWDLLGKSLAIISDARLTGRSDQAVVTERLLSITGRDAQTIDRKNLSPITTVLATRLMVLSNELPKLNDSSGALANRMLILHTPTSNLGSEDLGLKDRLIGELPGVLWWAIAGWEKLRKAERFVQPASADRLCQQLADLSSPISVFVRERCVVGPGQAAPVDGLYALWTDWCREIGRKEPGTIQTFGRDLTAAVPGITVTRRRDDEGRFRQYEGIGIRGLA